MGMFDREEGLVKQPFALNSLPFTLHSAQYVGIVDTRHGKNQKATVKAGPEAKEFAVFGVLASQIQRMEPGDIPCQVKIVQEGEANVFVPAETPTT